MDEVMIQDSGSDRLRITEGKGEELNTGGSSILVAAYFACSSYSAPLKSMEAEARLAALQ